MVNRLLTDLSSTAVMAGFIAVLVSYSGPLVILFEAARIANLPNEILVTWVWAMSMGAAITSIYLSWHLKAPIVTAWSAPGTVLLISLFPDLSLNEMVGAYLTAAVIIFLIGISNSFDKLIRHIPKGIAAGMMGGILFQFATQAFQTINVIPTLLLVMLLAFLLSKRFLPRYSVIIVFVVGLICTALLGKIDLSQLQFVITKPIIVYPEWSLSSTLSLAIPLVLVSLTGQYIPGMAVLRLDNYQVPAKPIICTASLASLFTAFFGGITVVLAAFTATLCTNKDAHPDPKKRYIAGMSNGFFYLLGAIFASAIVTLFTVLPKALIAILAGLALLGVIANNMTLVIEDKDNREAAIITFLATASGMSWLGLGAAFWGLVIGLIAAFILSPWQKAQAKQASKQAKKPK